MEEPEPEGELELALELELELELALALAPMLAAWERGVAAAARRRRRSRRREFAGVAAAAELRPVKRMVMEFLESSPLQKRQQKEGDCCVTSRCRENETCNDGKSNPFLYNPLSLLAETHYDTLSLRPSIPLRTHALTHARFYFPSLARPQP